ncbi:class I SAM-dependent methyltransferase [Streptomyces sp. NBC_01619]|uniref:Class I SAM-dependent methyltransferase n=1 Tax=Streptomyces pratisoli TaxID=3139917 RepID=A0ACC6QEL8_9ACTN|nr:MULTISPECIES: class I SAM-dependent methyltransferase [unclassified Streptomyces]MCX4509463.1 class I SAM-dependent methyltransferase [Streptomyces sp. NBC_01619]
MTVPHNHDHERVLWDTFAESAWKAPCELEPAFCWTQYTGHGPGPELLGTPDTVLEIGCGTGRHLAYLAQRNIKVTGVDMSPVAVRKASERWGPLGVQFVCAEALEHLAASVETYDAVYSVFGAAWFTDPERLLPQVVRALNPGGVYLFSHAPAIPGAYGPQGMYKGGFAGPAMYTYRYSYTPAMWRDLLLASGFATADAAVLDAPEPGHIGTLIVRGVR